MPSASKPAIIRAIFAAYMTNDRKVVEDALADDFRSPAPMMTGSTRRPISSAAGATATGSSGTSLKESSSRATRPL
jgi:hypothetical protein